ncbi:unnamed protein product [Effrenium voratum]|nr:unnamed protein product [Effrenium voratum]
MLGAACAARRGGLMEAQHSAQEIDGIVQGIIQQVLGDAKYSPELSDLWCDQILELSLKKVSSLGAGPGRPFKYIATCVISPQSAALDTAATAFWDTHSDSLCCSRLGNGTMDCIVTVYACRRDPVQ